MSSPQGDAPRAGEGESRMRLLETRGGGHSLTLPPPPPPPRRQDAQRRPHRAEGRASVASAAPGLPPRPPGAAPPPREHAAAQQPERAAEENPGRREEARSQNVRTTGRVRRIALLPLRLIPVRLKTRRRLVSHRRAAAKNSQNRKVTDFYPIRRSSRKSKTELRKKRLDDLITTGLEEGMEVQHIEGKGRAVFATRCFQKGDFVVEYHGDLLQINDAKKREAEYAQNPATGCYMYYFQYLCKTYCVDATRESGRMGRLINHSKAGNCQTKLHDINGVPHLILVASRDIDRGEELLYDYGDRSKASIAAHPWLKH
uniref:[histone H4]-lysine(20) N-methyltransferase n=1 Tax=Salarias fasciatus TaxID=181472 RepID=A0A672I1F7_SALFA